MRTFKRIVMKKIRSSHQVTQSHTRQQQQPDVSRAYPSGESLMRKRVRTCSESSSMAPRFDTGSAFARYFMASTSNRCPSTYRGSDVRSRCLRPNLGTTGMVNTLAMNTQFHTAEFASRLPKKYNNSPPDFSR